DRDGRPDHQRGQRGRSPGIGAWQPRPRPRDLHRALRLGRVCRTNGDPPLTPCLDRLRAFLHYLSLPMKTPPPEGELEDTRVANITELQQELRARSQQRDRAYLLVLTGSNVGESFRIDGGEAIIGRGQGVTVRLLDDGISRKHARVVQVGEKVTIEDM